MALKMRTEAAYGADLSYRHSETVTGATSEALLIPNTGREVSVAVQPGTSAEVQFTLSPLADVLAATATWHSWPAGAATVPTADSLTGAVTALRLVSVGASAWQVRV